MTKDTKDDAKGIIRNLTQTPLTLGSVVNGFVFVFAIFSAGWIAHDKFAIPAEIIELSHQVKQTQQQLASTKELLTETQRERDDNADNLAKMGERIASLEGSMNARLNILDSSVRSVGDTVKRVETTVMFASFADHTIPELKNNWACDPSAQVKPVDGKVLNFNCMANVAGYVDWNQQLPYFNINYSAGEWQPNND